MKSIEIPKFQPKRSASMQIAIAVGLFLSVAGVITATYYYLSKSSDKKEDILVKSGIDPSFLSELPTPDEAPPPVQTKPKTPKPPAKYTPPPPPLPPADVFVGESSQVNNEQIAQINALRAKSGKTMALVSDDTDGKSFGFTRMEGHFKVETSRASDSVYLDRVITADRMIPAILINEVISDIGGKLTAQVEEDVYGFHGKDILIPRGSRAVGRYTPLQRIGDERLIATWDRIITPEGVNIDLKEAQLADTMGRTGGYGEVDRRLSERYGLSILLSTINAFVGWQIAKQSPNDAGAAVANTYTTSLADVTGQILREQINVKPRLTMPAGSRIFINPSHDIFFPKTSSGTVLPQPHYKGSKK